METRAAKRKRVEEEKNRDGISNLPDVILHYILSFLPIEFVAQSSVLSKRWRYLWRSYPYLDFSAVRRILPADAQKSVSPNRLHDLHAKAMEFVNVVLASRHQTANIKKFRLNGHVGFSNLHDCIRSLVKHRIEDLQLDVVLRKSFDLPRCLFSCDSLRSLIITPSTNPETSNLKLSNFTFPTAHVMASSGLQSLHTLSLTSILFTSNPGVADLFTKNNFPVLKKLYLKDCTGISQLKCSCPELENLELRTLELLSLDVCAKRLEEVHVISCFSKYKTGSRVKILAPKVRSFYWEDNAITDIFSMETSSALSQGDMCLKDEPLCAQRLRSAANLLSVFCSARHFFVGSYVVELLSTIDYAGSFLSSFNQLRTLELDSNLDKREIPGIACLLRSSPKLHGLEITVKNSFKSGSNKWNRDLMDNSNFTEEQYWESQTLGFKSFQDHLKVVTINLHSYKAYGSAMILVKFLLNHGRVLEKTTLRLRSSCSVTGPLISKRVVTAEMDGFARLSSSVVISVV